MTNRKPPFAATRKALAHQLAKIDGLLPGTVNERYMRCGKRDCACKHDPPTLHGPYLHWTRTENGKTRSRYLNPEQLERYQAWFDNAHTLKDTITKLQAASIAALEAENPPPSPRA